MSVLTDGLIDKYHQCPWHYQCSIADGGNCGRNLYMEATFSCGAARGFDIANSPTDWEIIDSLKAGSITP